VQLNPKRRFFEGIAKSEALFLLAFFIPLVVRAIPEVLMGSYVVGFDTLGHYIPTTLNWLQGGVGFSNFIATAPFLFVLLMGPTSIGIPITISLKVLSPFLLGLLGLAVYFYANKTLSWSPRKSLLVVFFATLYFVALRISWDMLRSELALIFLFVTLFFLKKDGRPLRNGVLLSLAMLSVVFAHQLVALIMFVIILVTLTRLSFDRQMGDVRRLAVCSIPAIFLFLVIVYANYVVFPQFSAVSGWLGQSSEGFITLFEFGSYANLVVDTLGFLVFCYLPLLPLVVLGVRRFRGNLQLNAWILCVFIALSLAMANIFVAHLPYRWTLLLTYPLSFYAAEGFAGIHLDRHKISAGLIIATFSVVFIFLPNNIAFPYYAAFPLYMPTSMLQNTVSSTDCKDVANALQWAKTNMDNSTRLLVHRAFYGWASLALDSNQLILYDYDNPEITAQKLKEDGSHYQLWLIWWVNGSGWYDQPTVSSAFGEPLHQNGRIAIFAYNASVYPNVSDSEYQTKIESCLLF
jgi:hypothetical protein